MEEEFDPDIYKNCKSCPDKLTKEGITDSKGFKRWSLKNHPDKFKDLSDDEQKNKIQLFQDISNCNDVLYKSEGKCDKLDEIYQNYLRKKAKKEPVVTKMEPKMDYRGDLIIPKMESMDFKVTDFALPSENILTYIEKTTSPSLFCPSNRIYRSGYTTKYGTDVEPVCAKKSRKRTKSKKRRRTKRCSKGKTRRRSYRRMSGKRVKTTCVKKPLKCSPRKTRRRSYTTKKGTHVKASCVRRRRRS